MPTLLVEPSPSLPAERFGAADEAQDASYFAASASTRSFLVRFSSILVRSLNVLARMRPRPPLQCGAEPVQLVVMGLRQAGGFKAARSAPSRLSDCEPCRPI